MDFYIAWYKRQVYDENYGWIDTYYTHQKIVVLADSKISAEQKVNRIIPDIENRDNFRAVLIDGPDRVDALLLEDGFEGSFSVRGI